MEIRTLEGVSTADIAQTFNLAFSDYLVPIHLSESDMAAKMAAENTTRELSSGVFDSGKLVGFILIGIDDGVAYNGGTGVIPAFRGKNLTREMYRFLLPMLAEKGIVNHLLEVLTQNAKAIPVYQKLGFQISRTVACFKGKINRVEKQFAKIQAVDSFNYSKDWCDFDPTYQNSWSAISRTKDQHQFVGAFADGQLVGYIVYVETSARIKHFAVKPDFRRHGIGWQLFDHVQQQLGNKPMTVLNVDETDNAMLFLQKIGLEIPVRQYEMTYEYA
jgi:ribosomal protein S18 acetylase RimI-like enzyme